MKTTEDTLHPYVLENAGKITLHLDEKTGRDFYHGAYIEYRNKPAVCQFNDFDNTLIIYDIKSGHVLKKIPFPTEGVNGISQFSGFKWVSPDTIVIVNGLRAIVLANEMGKIYSKATIPDANVNSVRISTETSIPILYNKGKVFFLNEPSATIKNAADYQKPNQLGFMYDFNTKKAALLNIDFPPVYKKGDMYPSAPYTAIHHHDYMISFSASEEVLFYNTETGQPEYKSMAVSELEFKIKPLSKDFADIHSMMREMAENAWYGPIIYDKYRDCYYRVFMPENENRDDANARLFGLAYFDAKLNYIGATLLPKGKHLQQEFFVSPEGLCFSNNNPSNKEDNLNEDELSFTIYKLVKK
jgi:hypothetical protein